MGNCTLADKIELLEKITEEYVGVIRAPLVRKAVVPDTAMREMIKYVAGVEKAKEDKKEALEQLSLPLAKTLPVTVNGQTENVPVNRMISGAGKETKFVPFSDVFNLRSSVYTELDFVTEADFDEAKVDSSYIMSDTMAAKVNKMEAKLIKLLKQNFKLGSIADFSTTPEKGVVIRDITMQQMVDSNPAFGLLFKLHKMGTNPNKETNRSTYKIDKGVLVAIASNSYGELANATSSLMGPKSDEEIADIAGIEEFEVTDYVRSRLGFGGVGIASFVESIGKRTANDLGLTGKADVAKVNYRKVESGLGLLGLELLQEDGYVEPTSLTQEDIATIGNKVVEPEVSVALFKDVNADLFLEAMPVWDSSAVKAVVKKYFKGDEAKAKVWHTSYKTVVGNKARGVMFSDFYKPSDKATANGYGQVHKYVVMKKDNGLVKRIEAEIGVFEDFVEESDNVRKPTMEKPTKGRVVTKRRAQYSDVTEQQSRYINEAEKVPYKYNTGAEMLVELLSGMTKEQQREYLRTALGYNEIRTDVSRDLREGNEARNARIDKVIDDNLALMEEAGGAEFYFKFFIPKNNRAMVDSATVNPQSDKELARWLISQSMGEESNREFNREELESLLAKDTLSIKDGEALSDGMIALMLGAVQAFDGNEINGKKLADVEKTGINNIFQSFKDVMNAPVDELKQLVATGSGHIGQKLPVLYVKTKFGSGETFIKNDVTYEVDGLTNALFYKMLQHPQNNYRAILDKVGVVEGERNDISHVGDLLSADYMDNYQGLSAVYRAELLAAYSSYPVSLQRLIDTSNFTIGDKDNSAVTKAMRDFAKPGTMIINYGAGVGKIMKQAVQDYLHGSMGNPGLLDKIVMDGGISDADAMVILGVDAKGLKEFKAAIQSTNAGGLMENPVYAKLRDEIEVGIGYLNEKNVPQGPLASALKNRYGPYIELSNQITGFYNHMFDVFKKKLLPQLQIHNPMIKSLNDATKQEIDAAAKELSVLMPSLVRPDSAVVDNNTVIVGKKVTALAVTDKTGFNKVSMASKTAQNKYSNGKIWNITGRGLVGNVADLLEDEFSEPGAAALPYSTHTQDNYDITQSVMKVAEDTNAFALQVFDAMVLDANSANASKVHNEIAMRNNLTYSSLEDLMLRIEMVGDELEGPVGDGKKSFADLRQDLLKSYESVVGNRAEIFGNTHTVMQMSGALRSKFTYEPAKFVAELEKQLSDNLAKLEKFTETEEYAVIGAELQNAVNDVLGGSYTVGVARATWNGLYAGELADALQLIKEADTGLRTISGTSIFERRDVVKRTTNKPSQEKTTASKSEVDDIIALINSLSDLPKGRIRAVMKDVLNKSASDKTQTGTLLKDIYEGCK